VALACVVCDDAIAVDLPPFVGFIRGDDPGSDLCGFAVCESCFGFAGTSEKLTAMVGEAAGGTMAPVARPN
jgi:hypothetical protein